MKIVLLGMSLAVMTAANVATSAMDTAMFDAAPIASEQYADAERALD